MNIEITYKLKNNESIKSFELTPEQYFDPIKEGENYEDDSIAQHGDTIDYINKFDSKFLEDELDYSILKIQNSQQSNSILKTTYFGNESELRYFIDINGRELIVQCIRIAENCLAITRMERDDSNSEWTQISYSIGVNYKNEIFGKETWYYATKGEYIQQNIELKRNQKYYR